ncbi:MAG TPA: condensation domain-containing protein, partial [Candidatus Nanopelagicales bacterium]|nr:condensation domain-containing protein [Candidatus Nanopelagicales bacterium]
MNRDIIFQQVARGTLTVAEALALLQQGDGATERARFPLSESQRALWSIHEMAPGNTAYHNPVALRLRSDADFALLEDALSRLVRRHPMLRARIRTQDGEPVQEIDPALRVALEIEDVSLLSETYIGRKLRDEALRALDLEAGPSWRAQVFTGLPSGPILLLVFHHLFLDGVSIPVFLEDLASCYGALREGREPAWAPLQAHYSDHVAQQQRLLAGPEGAALRQFWQRRFEELPPPLRVPPDRPRPATSSLRGAHYRIDLPAAPVHALEALAERLDATPFVVMLAAWLILLRRYADVHDLAVGIPVMGRPGAAFERVIGYFSNIVVVRRALEEDEPFEALVRDLRETVLDAVAHSDYPFATLVRELGEPTRSSSEDFCRVAFYFQSWFAELERTVGVSGPLWTEYLPDLKQEGEFELVLDVHRSRDLYRLYFKYNPDIHEESAISRMGAHYRWLLEQVIADPSRPLSRLELVTPAERRQLRETWNQTQRPYPADLCTHELFEQRAAETPDRIAVRCGDQAITYRALNERSHRLAALLQARGVRAGSPVGILVERSLDLTVALLGVMKAGGTYVPLDPIYPPDRLAFMLEDSGAKLL